MRSIVVLLLLSLLAPAAPPAIAQPQTVAPQRVVLDNGLTVIVHENHATEIVTVQAWVKVGSRDETDELNGAAHFVEHMLFKGTRRRRVGQIDREVESLGGLLNASTSWDYTQYYIVGASRFFDRILDIQSDALVNSTFDAAEVDRERLVVIEELNRRDDTPTTRLFDAIYAAGYSVHPYRRPIGGSRAVIQAMTRDQLFAFYRSHYVPANVTVVVVGDVNAAETVTKVRRAYGGWRRAGVPRPAPQPEPPWAGVRRIVLDGDVRVTYLTLGWPGPAARDRAVYATDVLLYALGRGRGARLVRRVQEDQRLVQQISAGFPTAMDPTLFTVSAVTDPENLAPVEEAILAEVRAVRDQGVSDEELRRAKTLLDGEDVISTHTTRGFATTLGYYATVADLEFALTYRDRIRQVTREEVQRAAQAFLDPQRYAAVVLQPRRR
jgi:zinc protease